MKFRNTILLVVASFTLIGCSLFDTPNVSSDGDQSGSVSESNDRSSKGDYISTIVESSPSSAESSSAEYESSSSESVPVSSIESSSHNDISQTSFFWDTRYVESTDTYEAHVYADTPSVFDYNAYYHKTTFIGCDVGFNQISTVYFEDTITQVKYAPECHRVRDVYFADSVTYIGPIFTTLNASYEYLLGNITNVHLAGNRPTISDDISNFNGHAHFYYQSGAEGYDSLVYNGVAFYEEGSEPTLPDEDAHVYTKKAAIEARAMVKKELEQIIENDEVFLKNMPYMDINDYSDAYDIANEITKDCATDREKIKAIFDWVHSNIDYDSNYMLYPVGSSFVDRKGVCVHYVMIMADMMSAIGIPSSFIGGRTRVFDHSLASILNPTEQMTGHCILACLLDGEVSFFDPTNNYFDLTNEQVSDYFFIDDVDAIGVRPDGYDIRLYEGGFFEAGSGEFEGVYHFRSGYIQARSRSVNMWVNRFYNMVYLFNVKGTGFKYTYPVNSAYAIGLAQGGDGKTYMSLSNGRALEKNDLIKYLTFMSNTQEVNYNSYQIVKGVNFSSGCAFEKAEGGLTLRSSLATGKTVIPDEIEGEKVVRIGKESFKENGKLKEIVFGKNIKEVEESAFYNCFKLEKVTFNSGLQTIGSLAFKECIALTSLSLNDGLKSIDSHAFAWCTGLISVDFGKAAPQYSSSFRSCRSLSEYKVDSDNPAYSAKDGILYSKDGSTLYSYPLAKKDESFVTPAGLKIIMSFAFSEASNLKHVTINSGVTEIGVSAFSWSGLESLIVKQDADLFIESQAFEFSSNLSVVELGDHVIYLGMAFEETKYANDKTNYQDGLLYSGKCLIKCDVDNPRTSYTIKEGIVTIGSNAFASNRTIEKIEVPNGVEYICDYAFYNCSSLAKICLPKTLKKICDDAFWHCTALADIYFVGTKDDFEKVEIEDNIISEANIKYVSSVPTDF